MGQRNNYLASDSRWDSSLSRDERLQRWPANASFGLALDGRAARALAAADEAVGIAETARERVLHQAVYALLTAGASVRETADRLHLSKSRTGRIAKRLTGPDGALSSLGFATAPGLAAATQDLVLEAWGFSDLESATEDHSRGKVEPDSSGGPTHFGGLSG